MKESLQIVEEKPVKMTPEIEFMIDNYQSRPWKKGNQLIKLTNELKKEKVKIYCQEPYADDLLKMYFSNTSIDSKIPSKDLTTGKSYIIKPVSINFSNKTMMCEEVDSKVIINVPFSDYPGTTDELLNGKSNEFGIVIDRCKNNIYYGSTKKFRASNNLTLLEEYKQTKQVFKVKIHKLVKGGYIVLFDNITECFLPGSHAAANIIGNFEDMLGREISVVVDNYDNYTKLYVVSYKKYIEYTMAQRIHELNIGQSYVGRLTSAPTDFGIFVEFEEYFTGLIHKLEFGKDYPSWVKTLKVGDEISAYIKTIFKKGNSYRVVLTTDIKNIDREKLYWQSLKDEYCKTNMKLDYHYDNEENIFNIILPDTSVLPMPIEYDQIKNGLFKYKKVILTNVDVINETIEFDFCN